MYKNLSHDELMSLGHNTNSTSYAPRMVMDRAEGMYIYDTNGKAYLDFLAGIAVNSLGNCPPAIVKAIQEQSTKMLQISNMFFSEPQIRLQDKLTSLCFADRVYTCNSGTEANEAAIKLARRYQRVVKEQPDRLETVSFLKSFHGRTLLSVTATGQEKYHKDFKPLPPGFNYATFNDLDSVKALISEKTSAIIVEPIQGEGGIRPGTRAFLQGLRDLCDEFGVVLIFDEVQCGVGRTGHMFAHQYFGVTPDIMTLAKGLGGGVPIGAMLATDEVFQGFTKGSHASTYGGNPLMCVASEVVLDTASQPDFLQNVTDTGNYLMEKLKALDWGDVELREVRGVGLMVGAEVHPDQALPIVKAARENGLIFNTAGGNTLRFVPPLIATRDDVDKAISILQDTVSSLSFS